jgi:predicted DCC family thiol-disulfide oxidoreductase YuxK
VKSRLQVVSPPAKPLMIFDGDCDFCKVWIHRWATATAGRVDFLPYQDSALSARFPELPQSECERAVQLIATDGSVYNGAEAALRALAFNPARRRLFIWYSKSRWFAAAAEGAYRLIAGHRKFFSRLTRLTSKGTTTRARRPT